LSVRDSSVLRTPATVRAWLIDRVAGQVGIPAGEIAADVLLAEYGLDSVHALLLATEIEELLGVTVPHTLVWDHPTIDEITAFLAGGAAEQGWDRV
jgi:acyl carrier protein